MNSLIIKQNSTETVSSDTIHKLYLQVYNSNSHDIRGELNVNKCYQSEVEYLRANCPDLTINVTSGYYIPFVDDAVRTALATQIGDGTGVTQSDIDAINQNQTTVNLSNNTNIVRFPENYLFYQVNVNGCTNLEELSFGTLNIHWQTVSYNNCPKLYKFIIHDMVKWYTSGTCALQNNGGSVMECNTLTKQFFDSQGNHITNLVLPEGCISPSPAYSYLQSHAFERADIVSVTFPASIQKIQGFKNCKNLTSVDFLNCTNLTNIDSAFDGCTSLNLNFSNLPNTITSIQNRAFAGVNCTGYIDLPNMTGHYDAFVGCNMNNVGIRQLGNIGTLNHFTWDGTAKFFVIPSTVGTIQSLSKSKYFKCSASAPPVINNASQEVMRGGPVYVPDALVQDYNDAPMGTYVKWGWFTIKPMSDFAADKVTNNWDE